jgi:hypothetical protein
MSKSAVYETDVLKLLFNGTPIANVADNAASAPLASMYVALHTADPGEAGTQITSEATYGGYARIAVPRSSGGWVVSTGTVSPVADILFPQWASGATNVVSYWSIGAAASGASKIFYSGTVAPTITVQAGVQPKIAAASTVTED